MNLNCIGATFGCIKVWRWMAAVPKPLCPHFVAISSTISLPTESIPCTARLSIFYMPLLMRLNTRRDTSFEELTHGSTEPEVYTTIADITIHFPCVRITLGVAVGIVPW